MRWRLACFDLDGTLVPGTTVSQHLANALGHGALIATWSGATTPANCRTAPLPMPKRASTPADICRRSSGNSSAQAAASIALEGNDLRAILPHIPGLPTPAG